MLRRGVGYRGALVLQRSVDGRAAHLLLCSVNDRAAHVYHTALVLRRGVDSRVALSLRCDVCNRAGACATVRCWRLCTARCRLPGGACVPRGVGGRVALVLRRGVG